MNQFSPLFLSLAELALNVVFVVLFLIASATPRPQVSLQEHQSLRAQLTQKLNEISALEKMKRTLVNENEALKGANAALEKELAKLNDKLHIYPNCEKPQERPLFTATIVASDEYWLEEKNASYSMSRIRAEFSRQLKNMSILNEHCIHRIVARRAKAVTGDDYLTAYSRLSGEFRVPLDTQLPRESEAGNAPWGAR